MRDVNAFGTSILQQGMVFNTLSNPGSGVEIQQIVCRLNETYDQGAMEKAWQVVLQSYDVLRTHFTRDDQDNLLQTSLEQASIRVLHHDWSNVGDLESELQSWLDEDRVRELDLWTAPMIRVNSFETKTGFLMVWTFHHGLVDGRSFIIVIRDVLTHYSSFARGETVVSPKEYPFVDYIEWLERIENRTATRQYWSDYLRGYSSSSTFLESLNTTPPTVSKVSRVHARLESELSDNLRSLSQNVSVTLNTVFQGAWAILLKQYSRTEDVIFGATRASRHIELDGIADRVGLFINTVPMRIKIDSDMPLALWFQEIRKEHLAHRNYEQISLQELHEISGLEAGQSVYDTVVIFENAHPETTWRSEGPDWEDREFTYLGQTSFPVALYVYGDPQILVELEFDSSRIGSREAERLCQHLVSVLESLTSSQCQTPASCQMLSELEVDQLAAWNHTRRETQSVYLQDTFHRAVALNPSGVAVEFGNETRTYQELDQIAENIAEALVNSGLCANDLVGICVNRNIGMVAALLGVLKANTGYVPLDPAFPQARLKYMLEESDCNIVIYNDGLEGHIESATGRICIDEVGNVVRLDVPEKTSKSEVNRSSENRAYVIFTSGSTGKPKGVQVPHRAACNFVESMAIEPGISSEDALVAVTTLSFDIHVLEIFVPLSVGARIVIADRDTATDGWKLLQLLRASGATMMQATPMTWRLLLEAGWSDMPLKVLVGGEAVPQDLVSDLLERAGEVWNMYGPTETTVWSTCNKIPSANVRVAIGFPIANTQVHVLDIHKNVLPRGVPGELYIGGYGVTSGYIGKPELTSSVFIQDTVVPGSDFKLYRTGDLVVRNSQGSIEYICRLDSQVKVRGYRIELGEIEAAIASHPSVKSCAVAIVEQRQGLENLAAFCVRSMDSESIDGDELKSHSAQHLPAYMVPSIIVDIAEIPLTANGKLDRKALPALLPPDLPTGDHEEASTDVEREFVQMWEEVLGVQNIGINEAFTSLGGDSLSAMRVLFKMKQMGIDENVCRGIFQGMTIKELAKASVGGFSEQSGTEIFENSPAKSSMTAMNLLRGFMVILVVVAHWAEGLFERLPTATHFLHETLLPMFTTVTPGFAIVFGMSLGYIYYPMYLSDQKRAMKTLMFGTLLLFWSVVLMSVIRLMSSYLHGNSIGTTDIASSLYSALTYYFLAMLSVPLWFKIVGEKNRIVRGVILGFGLLAASFIANASLNGVKPDGFFHLIRILLVAKFNYFDMSVAALAGLGLGIFLKENEENILNESVGYLCVGFSIIVSCFLLKEVIGWPLTSLNEVTLLSTIFVLGWVVVLIAVFNIILSIFSQMPRLVKITLLYWEAVGLAALPIWILHHFVLDLKNILDVIGVPDLVGLVVAVGLFLGLCGAFVRRLHTLYYGNLRF